MKSTVNSPIMLRIGQKSVNFRGFRRVLCTFLFKMAEIDPGLRALHARIVAGELSKKEAAEVAGLSYAHLCVKLSRAGLIDSVRTARATAKFDSPTMTAALEEALSMPPQARNLAAIARKHGLPDEQYVAFASRVLHKTRSRIKADLAHDKKNSGAPATG